MAKSIPLTSADYGKAVSRTVTIEVTVSRNVRRWWFFRLWLAVQIARLAAWVGGTRFVLNHGEQAEPQG